MLELTLNEITLISLVRWTACCLSDLCRPFKFLLVARDDDIVVWFVWCLYPHFYRHWLNCATFRLASFKCIIHCESIVHLPLLGNDGLWFRPLLKRHFSLSVRDSLNLFCHVLLLIFGFNGPRVYGIGPQALDR